ncbi:MFS transporter [Lactobacillus delbrueckii subsp. bulgaricus]|nr:MFS transporter [Lactobacillus delbrueckii subsp. bulgaricus]
MPLLNSYPTVLGESISPLILVITRMVQGLSLGGEYGTSATYMSEMASRGRWGFYSSFQYVTLIAGQLFSLLVQIILQQVLTDAQLYAFGWRIPFPSSLVLSAP